MVNVALLTDDVYRHTKVGAEKELQCVPTAVAEWSTSKKMVSNAEKCEVKFFSTNSYEANW